MRSEDSIWSKLLLGGMLSAGLAALLEWLRLVVGSPFSWGGLAARWGFAAGLLLAAQWTRPYPLGGPLYLWPWPGVLGAGVGVGAAVAYAMNGATWAAWVVLIVLYLLLLGVDGVLTTGWGTPWRWGMRTLLALAGGVALICIAQIESRFADEEFFVALQTLALGLFSFLLLASQGLLDRKPASPLQGLRFDRRWLSLLLVFLAIAGLYATVRAYQHSFYPTEAPTYGGISAETPFLCGDAPSGPQTYDGAEVFRQLLAQVEANPYRGTPEYGMLALGTGDLRWAQIFHTSILDEATEGRFTGRVHSVKSVQYEAALRAYYLRRVDTAFPELFSSDEMVLLQEWFATINHRALTVEWVDWMYALAFAKRPEGPYENQENGAGLLALLESEGWAAPDLSPANRDYLERNQRGWIARFRNTDDAVIYQPEWITNAYFQSLYTGDAPEDHVHQSFEWLLLQALPDGAPLQYNHPGHLPIAGAAYLGAHLLEDPRYVWLAGRVLEDAGATGGYVFAQPGVERPLALIGQSPTHGSCLLYGDSGLPNQIGPLAPDKIVLRDGWTHDSAYLMLNLRFTGWHRYKATNTITLIHQDGSLASDALDSEAFPWLPVGRSAFRDKRIPRENLNGLLIERNGMSAVLYALTGIGGPWAQDPPHYAQVIDFATGAELDWAHTRTTNWRGWRHDRWVYLYHDGGPIVVVDEAEGPSASQAALAWHLTGKGDTEGWRIRLRGGNDPAEVLLMPVGFEGHVEVTSAYGDSSQRVVYYPPADGRLYVVTVFLPGQWTDAEAGLDADRQSLWIAQGQRRIAIPLDSSE